MERVVVSGPAEATCDEVSFPFLSSADAIPVTEPRVGNQTPISGFSLTRPAFPAVHVLRTGGRSPETSLVTERSWEMPLSWVPVMLLEPSV